MIEFAKKDQTVGEVGTIVSASHAFNFVKQYYEDTDTGLVSVLRLNAKREVIGITHNRTDMDLAWRVATVNDAVNEKGCVAIIVVYDKPDGQLPAVGKEVDLFDDLHKKLSAVQVSLTDVIAVRRNQFYSFADERISKVS